MTSPDRILVRDGRRHHRPTYSATEFRIGLVVLGLLVLVLAWVAWRGQRPEEGLFSAGEDLLEPGPTATVARPDGTTGAIRGAGDATSTGDARTAAPSATPAAARGPLPEGLVAEGWREGAVSSFGYDNLYEKINGREGYYKSFGFRELWFVSLFRVDRPEVAIDIEMYDLGEPGNALGAYAGERPPGGRPDVGDDGLAHLDRNALLLARGAFYIRAIGSDETPIVRAQLEHLRAALERGVPGEPLPWGYGLFVGGLALAPERVSYMAENAFSFGFARDVYAARLDDDTELFIVTAGSQEDAATLANQFREGFRSYGSPIPASNSVEWTEDRYIQTVAGAKSVGRWVIGVRGAPDLTAAESGISRIEQALLALAETTEE